MAKKKQKTIEDASVQISQPEGLFASEGAAFDPKLASLFSSSVRALNVAYCVKVQIADVA